MKFEERINANRSIEKREKESTFEVPTIDIVRHGETEYKELSNPNFKLDTDAPDFALDAKHLDLTEEGIKNLYETAEQLASRIDKENEAVLLVTSPQFRAMSSMLIIERVFAEHGIIMLNSTAKKDTGKSKGIKTSALGLGQIPIRESLKSEGFAKTWLSAHKQYREGHPEAKNKPPVEVHGLVAATLGKKLSEIFSRSHDDMATGFERFLRHAINIERYLQDETKEQLEGRKLRIVSVTHEERVMEFAKKSLALDKTVAKGQLLEIKPQGFLEKNGEIDAKISLYEKNGEPDLSSNVKMKFSQKGLSVEPKEL